MQMQAPDGCAMEVTVILGDPRLGVGCPIEAYRTHIILHVIEPES